MEKSLDRKLRAVLADPRSREFIIADAKDADMAFGIGAPGRSPEAHPGQTRFRTLKEYRDIITEIVRQELVDIMLMSASTSERLCLEERLFDQSPVTAAVRVNDTSDIHAVRGGRYVQSPSVPFRSPTLDHIQCGHSDCGESERRLGPDLGLYSVTFTNSTRDDLATLEAFKEFRLEAEQKGFRYFLEVFDPNVPAAVDPNQLAQFVDDCIVRSLAGVARAGRPLFLKMVYHGPQAIEELHRYDPSLVVGILGGSAGTTYDAFKLIAEAQKYGAKVALFGRKINQAENQFAFIRFLRLIVDGAISPEDAVRAYHAVLEQLGCRPHRSLEADMVLETAVMSYGGSGATISIPGLASGGHSNGVAPGHETRADDPRQSAPHAACRCRSHAPLPAAVPTVTTASGWSAGTPAGAPAHAGSANPKLAPDFAHMTSQERLEYHRRRIATLLGDRDANQRS